MREILDAYEQKTKDVCRVACDQLCATELVDDRHPIRREESRNGSESKQCQ